MFLCRKVKVKQEYREPPTQPVNDAILNVYNDLAVVNNMLKKNNIQIQYDIPLVVAIGSQSSGKSTLLNRVIGRSILPTGTKMVTRTPIQIHLAKSEEDKIVISYHRDIEIVVYEGSFKFSPESEILQAISKCTQILCGDKQISSDFIHVKIKGALINLILVDMIGIITTSQYDDGLVDKIMEINKNILSRENLFILNVIKATEDLETDVGYSFVKKYSKGKNVKKIGIITKIDLAKDLSQFESNDIFDYGFFGVSNHYDTSQYYNEVFGDTKMFKRHRLGVKSLSNEIQTRVSNFLTSQIPELLHNIKTLQIDIKRQTPKINEILSSDKNKIIFLSSMVNTIAILMIQSIHSVGNVNNIGMQINQVLKICEREIFNYNAMSTAELPDSDLIKIIKSYEGYNSTSSKVPLIVNHCVTNKETLPMKKIYSYILACISSLESIIFEFLDNIFLMGKIDTHPIPINKYDLDISQYSNIVIFLKDSIHKSLRTYKNETLAVINEQLKIQEMQTSQHVVDNNLIFSYQHKDVTRDSNLAETVEDNTNTDVIISTDNITYNITSYRTTIDQAFKAITRNAIDISHKTIKAFYLGKIEYLLNSDLLEDIKQCNIDDMFDNNNHDEEKVKNLQSVNNMIEKIITKLSI